MKRRTRTVPAAVVTAVLLLSAGCGSGDSSGGDGIAGADQGSGGTDEQGADGSAPAEDPDAPTFAFPEDFEVVIADGATEEEAEDELLRDHGYALSALMESYAQQEATDHFATYWFDPAYSEYLSDFERFAEEGWSIGGSNHYYEREIKQLDGDVAEILFCEDQNGTYSTDAESGERLDSGDDTETDSALFRSHHMVLERAEEGQWRVTSSQWSGDSTKCEEALR